MNARVHDHLGRRLAPRARASTRASSAPSSASRRGAAAGRGYFAEHDWRWIFYINLPIGIAALFLCNHVRLLPFHRRDHKIDWLGAALLVGGVQRDPAGAVVGRQHVRLEVAGIIGLIGPGAALATVFLFRRVAAREPILPRGCSAGRRSRSPTGRVHPRLRDVRLDHLRAAVPPDRQRALADRVGPAQLLPMMVGIIFTSIISVPAHQQDRPVQVVHGRRHPDPGGRSGDVHPARVETPLWETFIRWSRDRYRAGPGHAAVILAVQNDRRSTRHGRRHLHRDVLPSLGGSFGVARARRDPDQTAWPPNVQAPVMAAIATITDPAQRQQVAAKMAGASRSNEPALIKELICPGPAGDPGGFVAALHAVFLVSAGVTLLAVVLCLALPNRELKGARASPRSRAEEEDDELRGPPRWRPRRPR
jgi:hypothetical protein